MRGNQLLSVIQLTFSASLYLSSAARTSVFRGHLHLPKWVEGDGAETPNERKSIKTTQALFTNWQHQPHPYLFHATSKRIGFIQWFTTWVHRLQQLVSGSLISSGHEACPHTCTAFAAGIPKEGISYGQEAMLTLPERKRGSLFSMLTYIPKPYTQPLMLSQRQLVKNNDGLKPCSQKGVNPKKELCTMVFPSSGQSSPVAQAPFSHLGFEYQAHCRQMQHWF